MSNPQVPIEGRYELGDFELQSGKVLPGAHIGYATWGSLNAAGDNAIVYPTWYSGQHQSNAPFIGKGMALDPDRYFIVVPDMFTNGLSTSPSNCAPPHAGMDFPLVTPYDNVVAQHRLLTEHLGVQHLQLAIGASMSGQQAYHWGALYPDFVARICSICGSAKTSAHNWLYLNGYKTIMESAEGWDEGRCTSWPPRMLKAFTALGTIMAWSSDWYRARGYQQMGAATLAEFTGMAEGFFSSWVPADLYHQTLTWMSADISAHPRFNGDIGRALRSIKARALIMPCDTDMYFSVADNEAEVKQMPNAQLSVIHSMWGHVVCLPGMSPPDDAFIDAEVRKLLADPA